MTVSTHYAGRGLLDPLSEMLKDDIFFFLGICVGHQVLAETGSEFFEGPGLEVIPGATDKLCSDNVRLPHVGWNELQFSRPSPIFEGIELEVVCLFRAQLCRSEHSRGIRYRQNRLRPAYYGSDQ